MLMSSQTCIQDEMDGASNQLYVYIILSYFTSMKQSRIIKIFTSFLILCNDSLVLPDSQQDSLNELNPQHGGNK